MTIYFPYQSWFLLLPHLDFISESLSFTWIQMLDMYVHYIYSSIKSVSAWNIVQLELSVLCLTAQLVMQGCIFYIYYSVPGEYNFILPPPPLWWGINQKSEKRNQNLLEKGGIKREEKKNNGKKKGKKGRKTEEKNRKKSKRKLKTS